MTGKKNEFDHSGSSFDSFLEEEGILEQVDAVAIERVLAWKLAQPMKGGKISKSIMDAHDGV